MSPGERARTAIKTVCPIECLFSSPEKSNTEEPQSQEDSGTQDPPPCGVQESLDQVPPILVPYSPIGIRVQPESSNGIQPMGAV